MKKIILSLLCCVLCSSLLNISAGVESTTLVHTPQGLRNISSLSVGDEIICRSKEMEKETRTVTAVQTHHYDSCIEVTTADNKVMRLSHDQRVFTPFKWTPAECLSVGDALMNEQKQFVRIASIAHKEEPISIHFIEVDEHANFMISEGGILVHNGAGGASAGWWIGRIAVHAVGHTAIIVGSIPALVGGPYAYAATVATAEGTFAPMIESASQVVAVGTAIIGGTVTGPV